ncbi:MAG: PIN domain-containing protein [Anaerolineae bacterium]|nr:MAG: PIN domain-containing protein [Anaerolineae bacterium]
MRVYLDACCLNRPFDDQSQPRIHLETIAISLILEKISRGEWEWVGSETLFSEIRKNPDMERRERVWLLAQQAHEVINLNDEILHRAEEFQAAGFDAYDALHLASAEAGKVDVFLTTDDQILKTARRRARLLPFRVANPVTWLEEILK